MRISRGLWPFLADAWSARIMSARVIRCASVIAERGWVRALKVDHAVARGVNVLQGRITHRAVADTHRLAHRPRDDLLSQRAKT